MQKTVCAALYAALFLLATTPVLAEDVTLTSRDGKTVLAGTLLGYDGELFRIDTIYGELSVAANGVSCEGPACPNPSDYIPTVAVSGSATMGAVLLPALIEGFARLNGLVANRQTVDDTHFHYDLDEGETGKPVARFSFRTSNADEGFADLLANEADMVMSLREIRPVEEQRAREAGLGDLTTAHQGRVLALDAIVPIVAPGNPVRDVSVIDLARVYSGEITNWADLGGPDAAIVLHAPEASTGLGQSIEDRIMRPMALAFSELITRHADASGVAEAVTNDAFALGLASFAEIGRTKVLALTGSCRRSQSATRRSIKTGDYPLTSAMFLYLPARRIPTVVQDFLAFSRSPAAQLVIRRVGFVDQSPEEVSVDEQGSRLLNAVLAAGTEITLEEVQRMTATLRPMQRLSFSFRFAPDAEELDPHSLSSIGLLAREIEQGNFDGRQVLLVGFSDGEGPAEITRNTALQSAEAVWRALQALVDSAAFSEVEISVDAFGEAMPMACDDSEWGRQTNRRVEIWVR